MDNKDLLKLRNEILKLQKERKESLKQEKELKKRLQKACDHETVYQKPSKSFLSSTPQGSRYQKEERVCIFCGKTEEEFCYSRLKKEPAKTVSFERFNELKKLTPLKNQLTPV